MKEELKRMIMESHEEERKDAEKYHKMHEIAEQLGCDTTAGVLMDIKCDEETHRKALEYLLHKYFE